MLFPTFTFAIFFALVLAALALARGPVARKVVLLLAGYIFYSWWNPVFVLLMLFSTTIDYAVARRIERSDSRHLRKCLLGVTVGVNLGILALFKYGAFLQQGAIGLARWLGYAPHWSPLSLVVPVGISFYTFEALSYVIDVYRRDQPAVRSFLDYGIFINFFPHLVAGPIVRPSIFLPQLKKPIRLNFDSGILFLLIRGLIKKVVVGDNIGRFSDAVFATPDAWGSAIVWLGTVCFAIQIYCDFSGYSDLAIGLGRILGFQLPLNFNHPYLATNPVEFWRRWHITLSSWLRDYLYIPLGGNRRGSARTLFNLMVTMLIGGLWHGASWNFVLWGGWHGAILVGHRLWRRLIEAAGWASKFDSSRTCTIAGFVLTQYLVLASWIVFRVKDLGQLVITLRRFAVFDFNFSLQNIGLGSIGLFSSSLLAMGFLALHAYSGHCGGLDLKLARSRPWRSCSACLAAGFLLFCLWPSEIAPFIYFQF